MKLMKLKLLTASIRLRYALAHLYVRLFQHEAEFGWRKNVADTFPRLATKAWKLRQYSNDWVENSWSAWPSYHTDYRMCRLNAAPKGRLP